MVIYIILFFVAACIGMAISVYAFGTGGKRKKIFQDIYFSVEETDGVGVLYTKSGEYSAVLRMENPVQKYSANIDSYYEFSHLFTAIAQTLGEGYAIHKQDIISRKEFKNEDGDKHEFLSESYFLKCPVDLFYGCVELPENGRCNDGNQLFSFTDMLQNIECL